MPNRKANELFQCTCKLITKSKKHRHENKCTCCHVTQIQCTHTIKKDECFTCGINETEINTDKNGKPTDKWIYTTTMMKPETGKALLLSASKVLDRQIIQCLSKGITEFTIIKMGTSKDTRYSIKELI